MMPPHAAARGHWVGKRASSSPAAAPIWSAGRSATPASPDATATEPAAATEVPSDVEWLPLGVFNVAPEAAGKSSTFLQLSVNREGVIKGTFYDATTDSTTPVGGAIDKATRVASWRVGAKGASFETSLDGLVAESCTATVQTPGGESQRWFMVHVSKPSAPAQPGD